MRAGAIASRTWFGSSLASDRNGLCADCAGSSVPDCFIVPRRRPGLPEARAPPASRHDTPRNLSGQRRLPDQPLLQPRTEEKSSGQRGRQVCRWAIIGIRFRGRAGKRCCSRSSLPLRQEALPVHPAAPAGAEFQPGHHCIAGAAATGRCPDCRSRSANEDCGAGSPARGVYTAQRGTDGSGATCEAAERPRPARREKRQHVLP